VAGRGSLVTSGSITETASPSARSGAVGYLKSSMLVMSLLSERLIPINMTWLSMISITDLVLIALGFLAIAFIFLTRWLY
jgi:hypothetical protein